MARMRPSGENGESPSVGTRRRALLAGLAGLGVGAAGCTVEVGGYEVSVGENDDDGNDEADYDQDQVLTPTDTLTPADDHTPIDTTPAENNTPTDTTPAENNTPTDTTPSGPQRDRLETKRDGTAVGTRGEVEIDGDRILVGVGMWDDDRVAHEFVRSGSEWQQRATITGVPDADGKLGMRVALDGDTAVIGGRRLAFVYERSDDGWQRLTELERSESAENPAVDSVGLHGEYAVIGDLLARNENGDWTGAVILFQRHEDGWPWIDKLTDGAGDGFEEKDLGASVAVHEETIMGGAPYESSGGTNAGVVDVFGPVVKSGDGYTFIDWDNTDYLLPDGRDPGKDHFGSAVDLDGDTAVVGRPLDENPHGDGCGSANIFTRADEDWTNETKLAANDGDQDDYFGSAVAIDGDTVIIGAEGDQDPANRVNTGSAYVFTGSGSEWTQQAKLVAADPEAEDYFGSEVALQGDTALVRGKSDVFVYEL